MIALGIILSRAGSKGLPDKCVRDLLGRPVITYTFDHARASERLATTVLSTDSEPAKALARAAGIEVIDRPAELAGDTATVDDAARHAVETWETRHEQPVGIVVLLYGNIPVREHDLIDRAVDKLVETGADSVRSVAPVTKQHPDWVHRLDGDRMIQFRPNSIYRRQDLEPLYYHDGAVAVVTRRALFDALRTPDDHQSFLGRDRRAIIQECDEAVDIDGPVDLLLAGTILATRTPSRAPNRRLQPARTQNSNTPAHHETTIAAVRRTPSVVIADRTIARGRPTFVIAEAGVNHNGSLDTALRMVDVAADLGADAVKFQWFRADDLATASAATTDYQRRYCGHERQRDMLERLELSSDEFQHVKRRCDERSILFTATPFGLGEVTQLRKLGAPAIKIASTDLTNEPLIETAARTALPLIVSTGAATTEEIDRAVDLLRVHDAGHRLVLLHCVSCYPTPLEAVNLAAIAALHRRYNLPTGLSDHTTSTRTGALAVAAGACVLEKHFTLDPSQPGPDHALSLNPDQLGEYIGRVRESETALGTGALGLSHIEYEVRTIARKSVVSAVDIHIGDALTEEMLALKRPGTGLPPSELARLIGRRAAVDIPRDSILSKDMLQS